ncbi:MAG: ricin-type beta-trefoil lectin domain protein, partial [Sulfurovum sp.]|nr:ricin-type beta-trefoil lectin domain protein [Sulfurovum sp.]
MKKVIGLLLFLATTVFTFATDDHSDVRILATLVNPNSTTPGRIDTIGDVDFFKVQIPRAGTLTVGTAGSTNTYGSLLDSEGGYIVANDGGLSNNFRISRSVTAGIYYIRVRHLFYMTGTGPYSLVSQFTSDQTEGSNNTNAEPRISTRAFGGGCITKVGGYAKRQTCNDSNTQQNLEYSINRLKNPRLKNPSSNQCLTVQSHDNGSKIVFAPCQDDNQEQNFSYHSDTHKFVHTVFSNKCLDVHGGNRTDLILWSCHGGVNQQFYIQPGTKQSNTDSSASQRSI